MSRRSRLVLLGDAMLIAGFLLLHCLGARDCVEMLTGTQESVLDVAAGLAYVGLWFAVILVVPITLLALGLDAMFVRARGAWCSRRR